MKYRIYLPLIPLRHSNFLCPRELHPNTVTIYQFSFFLEHVTCLAIGGVSPFHAIAAGFVKASNSGLTTVASRRIIIINEIPLRGIIHSDTWLVYN